MLVENRIGVKLLSLPILNPFPHQSSTARFSISLIHQPMCLRIRERDKCRHTRCFHPQHIPYVIIPCETVPHSSSQLSATILTLPLAGTPLILPHLGNIDTLMTPQTDNTHTGVMYLKPELKFRTLETTPVYPPTDGLASWKLNAQYWYNLSCAQRTPTIRCSCEK